MKTNLNYKLLKVGEKSKVKLGDQIQDTCVCSNTMGQWRDTMTDFTVTGDNFSVRRPDAKSLEIIRILQEEWARLDEVKQNIMDLIYG